MRISDWSSDVCSSDLGGQRLPDTIGQEIHPVLGHALIDAARRIARKIPARETLRYARAHPLVELEAAWRGDRFRPELAEDLARALVRAYGRRSLDDETSRSAVAEDARLCVEAAIGEPVGQHGNAKRGPIGIRPPAVAENAGPQAIEHNGIARPLSCPPARQPENQRHEPGMRPPTPRLERPPFSRPRPPRTRPQTPPTLVSLG